MSKKHNTLFLLPLLFIGFSRLLAQNGLRIEANIANLQPTMLVLVQHFGGQLMPIDTALLGANGKVVWQDREKIPAGMCRILGVGRGVDIFVSDTQNFSFEADLKDFVGTIRFKNSPDNTLFFDYQRELRKRYQPLLTYRQQAGIKDDNDPRWQSRFQELNANIKKYVDSLYKKHPQSLATRFLKSYQEPKLPVLPLKQLSANDSLYFQTYAREHFFDNTFLSDERMVYTSTFPARLDRFLKGLPILPNKDLIKLVDEVIKQSDGTNELRKYLVGKFAQQFEFTPSPAWDSLYSHVVQKYVQGEASAWDASTLQKIKEITEIKVKLAIGKSFPSLPLTNLSGIEQPLESLKSNYTVLFFYDPGCSHCREATPKLRAWAKQNSHQLQVYAVSLENDQTIWKNFVDQFQLQDFVNVYDSSRKIEFFKLGVINYPTIYLLDSEKNIIARWLNVDQLATYFDKR